MSSAQKNKDACNDNWEVSGHYLDHIRVVLEIKTRIKLAVKSKVKKEIRVESRMSSKDE